MQPQAIATYLATVVLAVIPASVACADSGEVITERESRECLFNWAEDAYPDLFAPTGTETQFSPPWHYRYYNGTDSYIGTFTADQQVYYLGVDEPLQDVGALNLWLDIAGCPQPTVAAIRLNDSGIDSCMDESGQVADCPVAGLPGQDADYGRDATHDDDLDGHAGFSYTKLDRYGNELPAGYPLWSCVRDNVTGLIWEAKTMGTYGGLHEVSDRYSWYNTDPTANGGFAGYADEHGEICNGYDRSDPASYCNTEAYVTRVNQQGLCGARDWRLPDVGELQSIVSYDRVRPAIDLRYFLYAPTSYDHLDMPTSGFWSSSPNAAFPDSAWSVGFNLGLVAFIDDGKNLGKYVRLVRARK